MTHTDVLHLNAAIGTPGGHRRYLTREEFTRTTGVPESALKQATLHGSTPGHTPKERRGVGVETNRRVVELLHFLAQV